MTTVQQLALGLIFASLIALEVYSCYTFKRTFEREKKEMETSDIWRRLSENGYLQSKCSIHKSEIYFRCHVATSEDFSGQDEYDIIREELHELGLYLDDLYIDHDCVTGVVKKLT